MPTILFLVICWLFVKGIKSACKPHKARPRKVAKYYPEYIESSETENRLQSYDHSAEINRQCLTEQLLFVEDLISSESNPEKTLKYMKEKQRILTALADL